MALLDYTLSIPDSSPIFIYSDLNSNLSLGWNVTYGSAADPTLVPGRLPPPNSLSTHRTSLVGATASISWFGTAIYLLGSGTPGAYSTSIDYQTPAIGVPSSDTNSLGSWAGLDNAKHTIELIVTEPIEVGLQGAQLSIVIGQTGSPIYNRTWETLVYPSNNGGQSNTDFFSLQGQWAINPDLGNAPFALEGSMQSSSNGDSAQFTLQNVSAFVVYGNCDANHGQYSVSVSQSGAQSVPVPQTFTAFSQTQVPQCIMYLQAGLDQQAEYQVEMNSLEAQAIDFVKVVGLTSAATNEPAPLSTSCPGHLTSGIISAIVAASVVVSNLVHAILAHHFYKKHAAGVSEGVQFDVAQSCSPQTRLRGRHRFLTPFLGSSSTARSSNKGHAASALATSSSSVGMDIGAGSALPPRYMSEWAASPGEVQIQYR